MLFAQIMAACTLGGILSVVLATLLGQGPMHRSADTLVSFAAGVLLAAACLDLLPAAAEAMDMQALGATLLVALFGFFVLEKLALWRHGHGVDDQALGASLVLTLTLGDGVHNFVDGVLLAATFLDSPALGWTTTAGIVAHEIPQELCDYLLLLAAGLSRARALALNVLASVGSVVGGVLGYVAQPLLADVVSYAIVVAAASFLYIAAADLIPALKVRRSGRDLATQIPLLLGGAGIIWTSALLH